MITLGYYGIGNLLSNQKIVFDGASSSSYWAIFLSIFWLIVGALIRFRMFEKEIKDLRQKYEELASVHEKDSENLYKFSRNTRKIVFEHIMSEKEN